MFDPDSGGTKIPQRVRSQTEKRLRQFAEERFAGRYNRLEIRFRGQFCYVDAYTEPQPPGPDWPPADWGITREEYLERLRNTPTHLFRLRYFGDEERWGFAFYSYAGDRYELAVFPNGDFYGRPEDAFEVSAALYL
jgi:hypothetical protein